MKIDEKAVLKLSKSIWKHETPMQTEDIDEPLLYFQSKDSPRKHLSAKASTSCLKCGLLLTQGSDGCLNCLRFGLDKGSPPSSCWPQRRPFDTQITSPPSPSSSTQPPSSSSSSSSSSSHTGSCSVDTHLQTDQFLSYLDSVVGNIPPYVQDSLLLALPDGEEDRSALSSLSYRDVSDHLKSLRIDHIQRWCRPLLQKLMLHPRNVNNLFNRAVDAIALGIPDYLVVIKRPMDLGTIRRNLQRGLYSSVGACLDDMALVFDNALTFNAPSHIIHQIAAQLKTELEIDRMALEEKCAKEVDKKAAHTCDQCRGSSCPLCGEKCFKFDPQVLVCHGSCGQKIKRNAQYFVTTDGILVWCQKCYSNLPTVVMDFQSRPPLMKKDILKRKADEEVPEPWVHCDCCGHSVHQVCALYNDQLCSPCESTGRPGLGLGDYESGNYQCPLCKVEFVAAAAVSCDAKMSIASSSSSSKRGGGDGGDDDDAVTGGKDNDDDRRVLLDREVKRPKSIITWSSEFAEDRVDGVDGAVEHNSVLGSPFTSTGSVASFSSRSSTGSCSGSEGDEEEEEGDDGVKEQLDACIALSLSTHPCVPPLLSSPSPAPPSSSSSSSCAPLVSLAGAGEVARLSTVDEISDGASTSSGDSEDFDRLGAVKDSLSGDVSGASSSMKLTATSSSTSSTAAPANIRMSPETAKPFFQLSDICLSSSLSSSSSSSSSFPPTASKSSAPPAVVNVSTKEDLGKPPLFPSLPLKSLKTVRVTPPHTQQWKASTLPRTQLSDFIELMLSHRLRAAGFGDCVPSVTVRMTSNTTHTMDVPEPVYSNFMAGPKSFVPSSITYKQKCILLFQAIDGVDLCLFCLYVQEFDKDCPAPNTSKVYIAYIDSIDYFRPMDARTLVYHEILVSYLAWAQGRGFKQGHIWACPPQRGDNFIFWCHPGHQRTPSRDRLTAWYNGMLTRARGLGVLSEISSLWSDYFAHYARREKDETQTRQAARNSFISLTCSSTATHSLTSDPKLANKIAMIGAEEVPVCPPVFEGDYWVTECLRIFRLAQQRLKGYDGQDRAFNARRCRDILKHLMCKHTATPFNQPVDVIALNIPEYPRIVKEPMDLGTVRDKLRAGYYYTTIKDFAEDVRLTFANAILYNPPAHSIHIQAKQLRAEFQASMAELVSEFIGSSIDDDGVDRWLVTFPLAEVRLQPKRSLSLSRSRVPPAVLLEQQQQQQHVVAGEGALTSPSSTPSLRAVSFDSSVVAPAPVGSSLSGSVRTTDADDSQSGSSGLGPPDDYFIAPTDEPDGEAVDEDDESESRSVESFAGLRREESMDSMYDPADCAYRPVSWGCRSIYDTASSSQSPSRRLNSASPASGVKPESGNDDDGSTDEELCTAFEKPQLGFRAAMNMMSDLSKSVLRLKDDLFVIKFADVLPGDQVVPTSVPVHVPVSLVEKTDVLNSMSEDGEAVVGIKRSREANANVNMLVHKDPPVAEKKICVEDVQALSAVTTGVALDTTSVPVAVAPEVKKRGRKKGQTSKNQGASSISSSSSTSASVIPTVPRTAVTTPSVNTAVESKVVVPLIMPADCVAVLSKLTRDTSDPDITISSPFVDSRHTFLEMCQFRHYQFDSLRRAKHSSLMLLYHLHNPTSPTIRPCCAHCGEAIKDVRWHCDQCLHFDICEPCYSADKVQKNSHPHTLTPFRVTFV